MIEMFKQKNSNLTVERNTKEKRYPLKKDDDKYILLLSSIYIISEITSINCNDIVKLLKLEDIIL